MQLLHRLAIALAACAAALSTPSSAAQLVTRGAGESVRLESQTVDATLEDGLARVRVCQTFRYDGAGAAEAVYAFPLPEDAAMTGLTLTVGGERMEGLLVERKAARRVYDDIVRKKRDPALLEQVADGRFRLSVYPVTPGIETIVEIEYVQQAPLLEGAYRLTVPLGGEHARGARTSANVEVRSLRGLGDVSASLPDARVTREGPHRALVSFERSPVAGAVAGAVDGASTDPHGGPNDGLPDGLSVVVTLADGAPSFDVATYRDGAGDAWFLAVYSPGTARQDALLPRDIVLVLDTSGSMRGEKLERAKLAAHRLVDQVRDQDRVNIVRFSSDVSSVFPEPRDASAANRAGLHKEIDGYTADGGTALGDALARVAAIETEAARSRAVVLLTDGRPTLGELSSPALVRLAERVRESGLRLFTFGVGDDLDAGLLHSLAAAGGGRAEAFANPLEIESRLQRFLSRTSSPALRDLQLSASGVTLRDSYPRGIPDAYFGEQVVVTGRFDGAGWAEFTLTGEGPDGVASVTAARSIPDGPDGPDALALQYATRKLADLDAARRLRGQVSEAAYVAATRYWQTVDAGRYSTSEELTDELVRTSLRFGVQCAYTSFLAVEASERGRLTDSGGEEADGIEGEETEEEPIIEEFEVSDHNETDTDQGFEASGGDPEPNADSPFDNTDSNSVLGIGGGAGGKYGGRFNGRRNIRASGGSGVTSSVQGGLEWIRRAALDAPTSLRGDALALLAFLGDGHTMTRGAYRHEVRILVRRLVDRQDATSGALARDEGRSGADAALDQLLATLALTEAFHLDKSVVLRKKAALALERVSALLLKDAAQHSDEALIVAAELTDLAKSARLRFAGGDAARAELEHRGAREGAPPWIAAAALPFIEDKTERDERARSVAKQAIDTLLPSGGDATLFAGVQGPLNALRLWWIADSLHASGEDGWQTFRPRWAPALVDTQRRDGDFKGSWQTSVTGDDPARAMETTAAAVLALEAQVRLSGPPK